MLKRSLANAVTEQQPHFDLIKPIFHRDNVSTNPPKAALRLSSDEKAKRLTDPLPANVTELEVLLSDIPTEALRRALTDLAIAGISALKASEMARIGASLVATKDRDADDMYGIVREHREHGAKRVRLFQFSTAHFKKWKAPDAVTDTPSNRSATVLLNTSGPELKYFEETDVAIRVVAAEEHQRLAGSGTPAAHLEPIMRRVVFDVDRRTGLLALAFDQHGFSNPHESTDKYYSHYESMVLRIFGAVPSPVNIMKAVSGIRADASLANLTLFKGSDDEGPFTFARGRDSDVRSRKLYSVATKSLAMVDVCGFEWQPIGGTQNDSSLTLQRKVETRIYLTSREIVFDSASLSHEYRYVTEQLRRHA